MSEIDSRPQFYIPVRPIEIPAELLALPNDTEVININAPAAGWHGSGVGKAGDLIDCIRCIIARQVARRFYLTEAAQILADAHGLNSVELLKDMQYAFAEGHLTIRKFETGLPRRPVRPVPYWSNYVTPADIDAWLRGNNATYRFPVMPEAASAPVEALGDNELMEELLRQPEPPQDAGQPDAQDSASVSTEAGSVGAGEDETPEQRRERIQARVSHWKNQGVRDFTARVASEEKVSVVRIRQILGKGKKESVTKKQKAKPRKPATPFSGLMPPANRTR
jgi:hypothetical protein